jgi:ankyrin repeat protein
MKFLDLPAELVSGVFEEMFGDDWVGTLDWVTVLRQRLVCSKQLFNQKVGLLTYDIEDFNHYIQRYAFGDLRITADYQLRRTLNRMSEDLVGLMLQQKVRLPNESRSPLISRLRETAKALSTTQSAPHETQESRLDTLCIVALEHLGRSKVLDLLEVPLHNSTTCPESDSSMLAAATALGNMDVVRELVKDSSLIQKKCSLFGYPLQAAAIGGHEEAAELLLCKGADVEAVDKPTSGTALCLAARFGHDAVVRVLLKEGAKLSTNKCRRVIHFALWNGGHEAVIDSLLRHGEAVDAKDGNGETALHYAASIGARQSVVNFLLDMGANLESKDAKLRTPLFAASQSKRENMVKFLLAKGANIQSSDIESRSMLHLAARNARRSLIELLISSGIKLNAKDKLGETPLHMAVSARRISTVKLLLEEGADIQAVSNDGRSPLHLAVDSVLVSEDLVKLLLGHGANVSARTTEGKEALYVSVSRKHVHLTQLFLERGVDVNAATSKGETALHSAASQGLEQTVQLLLEHCADVNVQDLNGIAPLHLAVINNHEQAARVLLEKGADPKLQTRSGKTALHFAAPHLSLIDLLLSYGAELEVVDSKGWTVLFEAVASWKPATTVLHLIELGSAVDRVDNQGNTLLHLVNRHAGSGLVRMLCDRGVNVNSQNTTGYTPLHIVAEGYNVIVGILLDYGADPNIRDSNGRTALHKAAAWSNGHEASMQILIEKGADRGAKDDMGLTALDIFRRSGRSMEQINAIVSRLNKI